MIKRSILDGYFNTVPGSGRLATDAVKESANWRSRPVPAPHRRPLSGNQEKDLDRIAAASDRRHSDPLKDSEFKFIGLNLPRAIHNASLIMIGTLPSISGLDPLPSVVTVRFLDAHQCKLTIHRHSGNSSRLVESYTENVIANFPWQRKIKRTQLIVPAPV